MARWCNWKPHRIQDPAPCACRFDSCPGYLGDDLGDPQDRSPGESPPAPMRERSGAGSLTIAYLHVSRIWPAPPPPQTLGERSGPMALWSNGRTLALQAGGAGSIPARARWLSGEIV